MGEITKEDVYYSLSKLQEYIRKISEDEFQFFARDGRPIFTVMLPPKYELIENSIEKDYRRTITRLEFRING